MQYLALGEAQLRLHSPQCNKRLLLVRWKFRGWALDMFPGLGAAYPSSDDESGVCLFPLSLSVSESRCSQLVDLMAGLMALEFGPSA
jgi:hypothetical protein